MNVVLYIYSLPAQTFELFDASAGYWLSREKAKPQGTKVLRSALLEIPRRGAEVRVLERLWPLHEAVVNSTLEFSMIRMRNALK